MTDLHVLPAIMDQSIRNDVLYMNLAWTEYPVEIWSKFILRCKEASRQLYEKHKHQFSGPFCFTFHAEATEFNPVCRGTSKCQISIVNGIVFNPTGGPSVQLDQHMRDDRLQNVIIYTDEEGQIGHDIEPAFTLFIENHSKQQIWAKKGLVHRLDEPASIYVDYFENGYKPSEQSLNGVYRSQHMDWYENGYSVPNKFGWNGSIQTNVEQDDFGTYFIGAIENNLKQNTSTPVTLAIDLGHFARRFTSYEVDHNLPVICIEEKVITKSLFDTYMKGNKCTYFWKFFEDHKPLDGMTLWNIARKHNLEISNFLAGGPLFKNVEEEMLFITALAQEFRDNPNL
jgi:hypothetical protein